MMNNNISKNMHHFMRILQQRPDAFADVRGSSEYPDLYGQVKFYQTSSGVLVAAQFFGLPSDDSVCSEKIFAFHIHDGSSCTGNATDPFADSGMHYNPYKCEHPEHAGDMPPLFGNNGFAFEIFLTNRFGVNEIIGKAVIVHSGVDDFTTQPSGNSGSKIACGIIRSPLGFRA